MFIEYFKERKLKTDIKRYLMFELLFKAVDSMLFVTDVVVIDFDYYKVDLKVKKKWIRFL